MMVRLCWGRALRVATISAVVIACGPDASGSADSVARGETGGFLRLAAERPDEPPVMVNRELPFRYPSPLYARKVQGNVTLRLFVDRDGRILPESTRVEESSGYGSLDSAALKGSEELYFIPAKLRGEPKAVAVLFPVYFRHPEAVPLPGDSVLAPTAASRTPD